ncbi:HEPN domain-containing protein [Bacillus tianshenii]|nr:HEPN domain-containing protein [Bacillus tianshenii]
MKRNDINLGGNSIMFNEFKTEYLIVIDTKNSFCGNVNSFNRLLESYSEIKVSENTIDYANLKIEYTIQTGKFNNSDTDQYFHIKLTLKEETKLQEFEYLLRIIRTLLGKISKMQIEVLWDDISFYYANKAYPLIHELENLMRKLITKFMLINVGTVWTDVHTPDSVNIDKKKKNEKTGFLYNTDFIDLTKFLFDKYQTESIDKLYKKIQTLQDNSKINIDELEKFIPQSNWDRYFSELVECEQDFLKKRWDNLYQLRCKVAHNNRINRDEFIIIQNLSSEIKEKLVSAIENLDKIHIPTEEMELISENMASNLNEMVGLFLMKYKQLEEVIYSYVSEQTNIPVQKPFKILNLINKLEKEELITKQTCRTISHLVKIRNYVVHSANFNLALDDFEPIFDAINNLSIEFIKRSKDRELVCVSCKNEKGKFQSTEGVICEKCS